MFFATWRRRRRRTQRRPHLIQTEEIEKLIDLWHKEPVLYYCQSGECMNKDAKAEAAGRIFVALVGERGKMMISTTRTEGGETEAEANNVFKPRELQTIFSCCKAKSCTRVNGGYNMLRASCARQL